MTDKISFRWHCILLIVLISSMVMDATGIEITKEFGGPEDDYGYSLRSTADGFILAGQKGMMPGWLRPIRTAI